MPRARLLSAAYATCRRRLPGTTDRRHASLGRRRHDFATAYLPRPLPLREGGGHADGHPRLQRFAGSLFDVSPQLDERRATVRNRPACSIPISASARGTRKTRPRRGRVLAPERFGTPGSVSPMNTVTFALRSLLKSPGFTLVAVLALALGIGANSAIFSLIDAIFLRPLPYADAARIVQLSSALPDRGINQTAFSWPRLEAVRARQDVFTDVAASTPNAFVVTGAGDPEQVQGMIVSQNYFPLLGVKPRARPQLPARRGPRGRRAGRDRELRLLAEASRGAAGCGRADDHARRHAVHADRRAAEERLGLSAQPAAAVHDAPAGSAVPDPSADRRRRLFLQRDRAAQARRFDRAGAQRSRGHRVGVRAGEREELRCSVEGNDCGPAG